MPILETIQRISTLSLPLLTKQKPTGAASHLAVGPMVVSDTTWRYFAEGKHLLFAQQNEASSKPFYINAEVSASQTAIPCSILWFII